MNSGVWKIDRAVRFKCVWILSWALLLCPAAGLAEQKPRLVIQPGQFTLHGREASQLLLVQQFAGEVNVGPAENEVRYSSSDRQVVTIDNAVAVPQGNGDAVITAEEPATGRTASAQVRVVDMDQPHPWSFRNHVLAVMTKVGCNSGACHGALAGKGGFKLSLRGYDPDSDFMAITREARGRRIELADPGRSLLLAKPTGAVRHKGGVRLEVGSENYRVLAEWISGGAAPPRDDDPQVARLEILPDDVTLRNGGSQQFVVRAHYDDGRVEDVTGWSKFTSTDETVATVDDAGRVQVVGHGGGAVTAWFASKIVVGRIAVPYENQVPQQVYDSAPRHNFIDELVLEKLASLRLRPSPPADDGEFLRRVYLDTIGLPPTAEQVRALLADTSPEKRDRLIDELLEQDEFVDYWAYKWSDLLLVSGERLRPQALESYYGWIRQSVKENVRWDEFVRRILTAKGSSYQNGATNFFALHQDPLEMAENSCKAFLGLSINCARCHNHPLEKWTNNQYYAMANLFARVRAKGWGGDFRRGDGKRELYVADQGDLIQPLTGKPQPPAPLDGEPIPIDSTIDRRVPLADWMTSPENPYFARAIANRVWANYLGVGLVEPVDDLRMSNPASNEKLLSALADYLIEHDYDLKALMRLIMQSATYQRSSRPLPDNRDEQRFYSRYYPKRLMAEVLLDSISQVTGVPTRFKDYPDGTRALELPDSDVESVFLKTFGRPERLITCECERTAQPSMVQVLHISNGDTINEKLASDRGVVQRLIQSGADNRTILEEAYLSALARLPTDGERQRILAELAKAAGTDRRVLIEDLYWGLLSSREFLFNH